MSRALDNEAGKAKDFMDVFVGETEESVTTTVDISREDDDQLHLAFEVRGTSYSLWMPADRIRKLLSN